MTLNIPDAEGLWFGRLAVLISVGNTGPGVTEAAFERRNKGGLGLSNVERRLQQYGGGTTPLVIRSMPDSGTTVEIRVPLETSETAMVASGKF